MKHLFWLWLVGFSFLSVAQAENGKAYTGVYHCEDPGDAGIARNPSPLYYVGWANVSLDGATGDISAVMGVTHLSFPPERVSGRSIIDSQPGTYVSTTLYRLPNWDSYSSNSALEVEVLDFPGLHAAKNAPCLEVHFHPDEYSDYICVPYADWKGTRSMTPAACQQMFDACC